MKTVGGGNSEKVETGGSQLSGPRPQKVSPPITREPHDSQQPMNDE